MAPFIPTLEVTPTFGMQPQVATVATSRHSRTTGRNKRKAVVRVAMAVALVANDTQRSSNGRNTVAMEDAIEHATVGLEVV